MKFYRAVVEDNNDPEKLGRVKVRVYGLHSAANENSSDPFAHVKTDDLPWAEVMGGTEFGLNSGKGLTSVLRKGTWVWVVLDNGNPNKPIVVGTIIGKNIEKKDYSSGTGFCDPDKIYPYDVRLDETDLHRFAKNEKLNDPSYDEAVSIYGSKDTPHKIINDNADVQTVTDSPTGTGVELSESWTTDVSQTEPVSLNDKSEYPNVNVLETHSGHHIELDDTPGNERVRVYHTAGSYIEIRPDGTFVQKCVNDDAESHYIHMSDVYEHIAKGVKRYIENNLEEIIDQNVMRNIKGNLFEHVNGKSVLKVDGDFIIDVGGNFEINSGGFMNTKVSSYQTIDIGGYQDVKVSDSQSIDVGSSIDVKSGGSHTVENGGNHSITAPRIDLN